MASFISKNSSVQRSSGFEIKPNLDSMNTALRVHGISDIIAM